MAETILNSSSNILEAFALDLRSPTARPQARPPYSEGEDLNSMEALVILVNLNENKRLCMFCICDKGTLTEHKAIWKLTRRAKLKLW